MELWYKLDIYLLVTLLKVFTTLEISVARATDFRYFCKIWEHLSDKKITEA